MTIFTSRKNMTGALSNDGSATQNATQKISTKSAVKISGNIFFALFAAVAMVGAVGYGFNNLIQGPLTSMSDVTRRTVTENSVITASRVAIVNSTTQQTNGGDCDLDGMIEPLQYRDAGANPKPTGGGWLPTGLLSDTKDPWNSEFGYCAWDAGSLTVANNVAGCGGSSARRLTGSPHNNQYAIAIISPGKDRRFQTTCIGYVDTTPADNLPDTPLLVKTDGSDDIVLGYTYAEANNLGNGLWKEKPLDATTLQTNKSIEVSQGATFSDKVVLTGNTTTGGGLVLPGDPGDNSLSGACDVVNERQLRRNTSTSPPTIEICDWNGGAGLGWTPVSGTSGGAPSGPADCTGLGTGHYNDPLTGHCYWQDTIPSSDWPTAQSYCIAEYGYLVTPTSVTENALIETEYSVGPGEFWLGFSDDVVEADWKHYQLVGGNLEGSTLTYTSWKAGEPSNSGGGAGEDCATYSDQNPGEWNDENCLAWATTKLVCEKTGTPSGGGGGGSTGSLVSRWKLDEAAGTTADDFTGSNDGTTTGPVTWAPAGGQDAGALTFSASSGEQIDITRTAALEPSAVSITMWIKRNGAQAPNATLIAKAWESGGGPTYDTYLLQFPGNSDDSIRFLTGSNGGNDQMNSPAAVIPDNTWTHIAATYDPSANAPQKKLYINGVLNTSKTLTDPLFYDTTATGNLAIGNAVFGTEGFVGTMDDVRIYNYAISDVEVQNIINTTSPPVPANKPAHKPGKLFSWGDEMSSGVLGNGPISTGTRRTPGEVLNGDNVISVSSANFMQAHACAVKSDGTVWCWGDGGRYALGNGNGTADRDTMMQVAGVSNAVKVSAGAAVNGAASCALTVNGQIWCWGSNDYGQVGTGSISPTFYDGAVRAAPAYNDFVDVATTGTTTCGVRYGGSVLCWGEGIDGSLGNGSTSDSATPVTVSTITNFAKIFSGPHAFCGVTKSGTAWCWGREANTEFANGTFGVHSTPSQYSGTSDFVKMTNHQNLGCGLTSSGTALCYGTDTNGQRGDGTLNNNVVANIRDFVDISSGFTSGCGLRKSGELWCWGNWNELGTIPPIAGHATVPTRANIHNVLSMSINGPGFAIVDTDATSVVTADKAPNLISTGRDFACAIIKDGGAACWGDDTNGELGNGAITGTQYAPSGLSSAGPWQQISSSANIANGHSCAIKGDGSAWCWGMGTSGQLGNGNASQTSPVVVDIATRKWSQVSAGTAFSCGIEADSELYCWGDDTEGRMGNGAGGGGPTPSLVSAEQWKKISAGNTHACGIKADGSAWCWGDDDNGQLGNDSSLTDQNAPVQVSLAGRWIDISAGDDTTCGIRADGTAWCWGLLTNIEPTYNTARYQPIMVMDDGPWTKIKATLNNACGIKADGSLWCWGEGSFYVLGQNSTTDYAYPRRVLGGGKYIDVSVGYDFACGMKSDYTAFCWGKNTSGQIGNPGQNGADATRPARVDLTPQRAGWEYNAAQTSLQPVTGLSPTIGTSLWISDDGAATKGLNLEGSGRSQIRQPVANQLLVEGVGSGFSSQLSLRAPSAKVGTDVTTGLVGKWTFDNTAVTAVNAPTLNATLFGTPTYATVAKVGTHSLKTVAASSQYARTERDVLIETPAITVSGWINLASTPTTFDYQIVDKTYQNGTNINTRSSIGVAVTAGKQFAAAIGYTGNSAIITGTTALSTNQWNHYALTYDPSAPAPQMKLYTNGRLDVSMTLTQPILYDSTTAGRLFIGRMGWVTQPEYFDGMIDDTRIYNRALDGSEVAQLYYYTSQDMITRTVGVDATTGNFEIARNNDAASNWLSSVQPDLEINSSGNVGIATTGAPASKLDVNGAIKIGNSATCNGATEGTLRWTGTAMEYCDGTWKPFVSSQTSGGGGSGGWNISAYTKGLLASKVDATAWAWGSASDGRLGNNQDSVDAYGTPVAVWSEGSATPWTDWIQTSGSEATSCGIRADGGAWCWGFNLEGQVGSGGTGGTNWWPKPVRNTADNGQWFDWVWISAGAPYDGGGTTCGIRVSGTAYCWGDDARSAVGAGTTSGSYATPEPVHSSTNPYTPWTDWKFIESGSLNNSAGIRANGGAYTWGHNLYGLGFAGASNTYQTRPELVKSTGGGAGWTDWKDISPGGVFFCGIRANGQMYCWGNGSGAQLGDAGATYADYPIQTLDTDCVSSSTNWKDVDAGSGHACAIKSNGTMWCWGGATFGKAGNNDPDGNGNNGNNYCMAQVLNDAGGAGWGDWVGVSADENSTCGTRANGTLWCWGESMGPAGADAPLPVQVQ